MAVYVYIILYTNYSAIVHYNYNDACMHASKLCGALNLDWSCHDQQCPNILIIYKLSTNEHEHCTSCVVSELVKVTHQLAYTY